MRFIQYILIVTVLIVCSSTAWAQEVYESVDEQGVTEFSDMPSPGAEKIEVKPNVVDVDPVERGTPPSETPASVSGSERNQESDAVFEGNDDDVYERDERHPGARKLNKEQIENPEIGKDITRQPKHR